MNDDKNPYVWTKCGNCSGYGGIGKIPNRIVCPSCLGKGALLTPTTKEAYENMMTTMRSNNDNPTKNKSN